MPNKIRDLHTVDRDSFSYIYEENVSIRISSVEGIVRCNVYRPKGDEKVPVLVTYGPYGKDIPYSEYVVPLTMDAPFPKMKLTISVSLLSLSAR
jgi:hypothetical protein